MRHLQAPLFFHRLFSTPSKIKVINTRDKNAESGDPKFFAVIETSPTTKEALKSALMTKGLRCMDYTGDSRKIAVGFCMTSFVKLMESAIAEVEAPPSNEPTSAQSYRKKA